MVSGTSMEEYLIVLGNSKEPNYKSRHREPRWLVDSHIEKSGGPNSKIRLFNNIEKALPFIHKTKAASLIKLTRKQLIDIYLNNYIGIELAKQMRYKITPWDKIHKVYDEHEGLIDEWIN